MKLITQRDQIRTVAARWKEQYYHQRFHPLTNRLVSHWSTTYSHDSTEAIYNKLAALDGETATAADIDAIVGNNSWSSVGYHCSECDTQPTDAILQIGEEPDYDSATAFLCRDCAAKVANAFPPTAGSVNINT